MKVNFKTSVFFFLLLSTAFSFAPAFAQSSLHKDGSQKEILEYDYDNTVTIDHSIYGVLIFSKDRWKNWVMRCFLIFSIFLAVFMVMLSLPKNNEINLVLSYTLSGGLFVLSFWATLAGMMLAKLNRHLLGYGFMLVSVFMYGVFYFTLMRVKKSDISFASLKESFQKMSDGVVEDSRLTPVAGTPGDWTQEDFVR